MTVRQSTILLNEIVIPRNTLIVLCGPAASGKSTWAAKHFLPTQVVSSDECRALVFDDAANQSVSQHAFDLMHFIIAKRLTLGRLTVADATNLKREHRKKLLRIAWKHRFNTAVIVFNIPIDRCLERNANRTRSVPRDALSDQHALLEKTLRKINEEGFNYVCVLDENSQLSATVKVRRHFNRRSGPQAP